jgi:hypothetical protein
MHAEPIVEDQAPLNFWMPDANRVHLHIWIVVDEEPMLWLMRNRCSDSRNMQHLPPGGIEVGDPCGLVLAVGQPPAVCR